MKDFSINRPTESDLRDILQERILIMDGAMGTMIQQEKLQEGDFKGDIFKNHSCELKGNNDLLSLTRPEVIKNIHQSYYSAGSDLVETNTFSATSIAMADYQLEDIVHDLNVASAKLAREAEIRYCTVAMVTDYDCWHPDHDEVDVAMVIQTLQKNASNAQNMIKEVIKTFKDFSVDKDPANNCLDTAIITDPKLRTKKTIKKLKYIAGRALNKK